MAVKLSNTSTKASQALAEAFATDDATQVEEAIEGLRLSILDDVTEQYKEAVASNDAAVLAQRGFRQLTASETKYYEGVINALKSRNPKQEFTTFANTPDGIMPTTIFDQVLKDIQEEHPLLAAVNVIPTGYITRWMRNKHTRQLAAWGEVGSEITQEITSAFEAVDVKQGKLSCFSVVSLDMLELGPVWMDGYIRTVIGEAAACGLEFGIVSGKGIAGEPVGLDRDIHEGVSVSTTTGYPRKTKVNVKTLTPSDYGKLVARLAKDESGKSKTLNFMAGGAGLTLICSPSDYLTTIMPATTVQAADGHYVNNLFPVPTQVIPSVAVTDGEAILALLGEYDLFAGGDRGIEFSDEVKFIEDQRAFKTVLYAFGKAYDNTSALLLNISNLDPAYITVKNIPEATEAAAADSGTH